MVSEYVAGLTVIGFLSFAGLAAPLLGHRFSTAVAAAAAAYTAIVYGVCYLTGALGLPGLPADGFSALVGAVAAAAIAIAVLGSYEVYRSWGWGESVPAVAALMLLGVAALASATNLVLLYAAWILGAAATYIMVALAKDSLSAEAATKYAVMGGVASLTLVAGLGYLFLGTGSLAVGSQANGIAALAATALAVTAAGYKLGVVPYHGWVPDVYGYARPILVAMASAAAKAIAVLVIVRLLANVAAEPATTLLLALLAAATMTLGNAAAAAATRPQLVLAYSSIAQAGYLLAGITALTLGGDAARLAAIGLALHVAGYVLSKPAAFIALDVAGASALDELKGFWRRDPAAATGLVLGLSSLLGMPPTLGFWGKLYIVLAIAPHIPSLAVVMAANFAIGAYYYSRMISAAVQGGAETGKASGRGAAAALLACLSLLLGLVPWLAANAWIYGIT